MSKQERKVNVWDYIHAISSGRVNRFGTDELPESKYNQWMTGRHFSHFVDTVFQANLVNKYGFDRKQHFNFLFHTVEKKKRYRPWPKHDHDRLVESLVEMGYSQSEAVEIVSLVPKDVIEERIKEAKQMLGGRMKGG